MTTPTAQTRLALPDDVAGALEVWRASRAADGARPSTAALQEVRERLAARDGLLVVAAEGEQVRGLALGAWVPAPGGGFVPGLLRLALLAVHPASRRTGVGAQLAEALADAGWARGARRLVVLPDGPAAVGFLTACGLEPGEPSDGVGPDDLVGELEPPVREVVVRSDGLRLGQLLKLAGLVETGAEGKALLESGGVQVDGEVELRRGRQLRDGEVVLARDQAVRLVLPPA